MQITENFLKGSYLINLEPKIDERGFFARYFCEREFAEAGLNNRWVQINTSYNRRVGTLRGLHFQRSPHEEIKLIRCIRGAIWDVIVDLRDGSETLGKWFGKELTDDNRTMMYVPAGFAHGFVSISQESEIVYLVSNFYCPEAEQTLRWDDQKINIAWPIAPSYMSDKDRHGSPFKIIQLFTAP